MTPTRPEVLVKAGYKAALSTYRPDKTTATALLFQTIGR